MKRIDFINMASIVDKVFMDCLLNPSEISVDNKPLFEVAIGEGVSGDYAFNLNRLNAHRFEIETLINELPDLLLPRPFMNLKLNRKGACWGGGKDVEQLVALGTALEILYFPVNKDSEIFAIVQKVSKKKESISSEPETQKQPNQE